MSRKIEFLSNVVILDTETTSLDVKEAEVIELGYALYNGSDWATGGNLYKATIKITPEISFITNITEKMVADKPFFSKAIAEDLNPILDSFVGVGNIVAHNAQYDENVLKNYSYTKLETPWICTLQIAKKLYGNDTTVANNKLGYLRYRFDLDIPEDMPLHRASADAYMTGKLLEYLVDEMISRGILDEHSPYSEQILDWLAQPTVIEVMPFGKHKGKKLVEIPASYWIWALENMNILQEDSEEYDPNFAASVEAALEQLV